MTFLSTEQIIERQQAITEGHFADEIIDRVDGPHGPDNDLYTVSAVDGLTFGGFKVPKGIAPPQVGDPYRLYGVGRGGLGAPVGGDLRGVACWYKTTAEQDQEHAAMLASIQQKRQDDFNENCEKYQEQYEALPDPLKRRVDRYVANCPTEWWVDFGGYELYGLTAAVAIAKLAAGSPDPENAIKVFSELSWAEKGELVPESVLADSGNLHSYALRVASTLVMDDPQRDLILEWDHGALTPLTGCDAYGCAAPPAGTFGDDDK